MIQEQDAIKKEYLRRLQIPQKLKKKIRKMKNPEKEEILKKSHLISISLPIKSKNI